MKCSGMVSEVCYEMNQPQQGSKKRAAAAIYCIDDRMRERPCANLKTDSDVGLRRRSPSLWQSELPQPEPEQEPPLVAGQKPSVSTCSPAASRLSTTHRLRFSTTISVRVIDPSGISLVDNEDNLKKHDGPDPIARMIDKCLHAFFMHRGNRSLELFQCVLGAKSCSEIAEHSMELSDRFWELALHLDNLDAGQRVGVLPSCTQVSSPHARGIKQLAIWLRYGDISDYPGNERIKRLRTWLQSSGISG